MLALIDTLRQIQGDGLGRIGLGLQHLAVLVGRQAHAALWPEIISWLHAHA